MCECWVVEGEEKKEMPGGNFGTLVPCGASPAPSKPERNLGRL